MKSQWKSPDFFPVCNPLLPATPSHRDAVINACIFLHQTLQKANARLAKRGGRTMAITRGSTGGQEVEGSIARYFHQTVKIEEKRKFVMTDFYKKVGQFWQNSSSF